MNENYEAMEMEATELEPIEVSEDGCELDESKSKLGLGGAVLLVGGVVTLGALAVKGITKLVKKNADKPKKQKTKLMLVRVPVEEDIVDDYVEEVPAEEDVDNNDAE